MIKAVLFDLDDTLLTNPINRLNDSFAAWNKFFSRRLGVEGAIQGLNAALHAVTLNRSPVENNYDICLRECSTHWQRSPAEVTACFADFYADPDAYPVLRSVIEPRPGAPELVHWLQEAGYQVVIATNPLFAAEGVSQRLSWGHLSPDFKDYALVTHIENMQFAKPNPHYYEEILGRLGLANDEAIMVGDDWLNDIAPAEQAGLNTFWVRPDGTLHEDAPANPDGQGTLADFARLVQTEDWLAALQPRPLRPAMIGPRLLGNVGALFSLLREHAPDYWQQRPLAGEWSPLEVVCHLRDSEVDVQRPRLQRIATEDNPFLSEPQAPPRPGEFGCDTVYYCDPAEDFAAERQQTVAYLEGLPADAWYRPARHSIFGPTTLLEMADFTATHDRLHLQQICQTIGRCE